jgi:zinc/manganese transport system substrate-binding protein
MSAFICLGFLGIFLILSSSISVAEAKLSVITTTTTLKAITEEIAGERATIRSITRGPQDPHFVEAKPSYMVNVRSADLVVAVGMDLEDGWLPNILRGARNPRVLPGRPGFFSAEGVITAIEIPDGRMDRSQGDVHPGGNPHFYLDPDQTIVFARALANRLSELDPEGKEQFEKNFQALEKKLKERTADWKERVSKTGIKKIISYHNTLNYFLNRFGLEFADAIEARPGVPPSAKHFLHLQTKIREENIRCILLESFFEKTIANRLQKEVPIHISRVPSEVEAMKGVSGYEDLIETLVKGVEACGKAFPVKAVSQEKTE